MDQRALRSILMVMLLANGGNAAEVLATRLDGQTISGILRSWDREDAVVETVAGSESLPLDELLSLRWQPAPSLGSAGAQQSGRIELVDGTLIPIETVKCSDEKTTITPRRPSADPSREVLPKRLVAAVQLGSLEAEAAVQWQEIRDLRAAADVLVVLKRDGKSLDYVECVLGDVTEDRIEFELEGEPQSVDRKKIAGFLYYRRQSDAPPDARFTLKGRTGLLANAVAATLANDMIRLTTAAGAEIEWPVDDLYLADFSAGKILYLSDIEPASQKWTPLVGYPSGSEVAMRFGEPRRDQSAYGESLALSPGHISASSGVAAQVFAKGLAIRSRTELVYRLPSGFRRLKAVAGIDPAAAASGNVRLKIMGDDKALLDADIAGTDVPHDIDLDMTNVKRLRIVVDYGKNLDTGDWLNLCDARLVK
jgi:hypothetical protein